MRRFLRQVIIDQSIVSDDLVNRYYDIIHRGNFEAFLRIANKVCPKYQCFKILRPLHWCFGNEDAWISSNDAEKFRKDLQHVSVKVYPGLSYPAEEVPDESASDILNS